MARLKPSGKRTEQLRYALDSVAASQSPFDCLGPLFSIHNKHTCDHELQMHIQTTALRVHHLHNGFLMQPLCVPDLSTTCPACFALRSAHSVVRRGTRIHLPVEIICSTVLSISAAAATHTIPFFIPRGALSRMCIFPECLHYRSHSERSSIRILLFTSSDPADRDHNIRQARRLSSFPGVAQNGKLRYG